MDNDSFDADRLTRGIPRVSRPIGFSVLLGRKMALPFHCQYSDVTVNRDRMLRTLS